MYLRQSERTIYKMKDNESVFHNKKALAILSIGTITILGSMAVSPALAGIKNTLILGIILYLIGGVGGGLMANFYSMLTARAILGISCGLLMPLAQTLISANFSGEFKERLTGYPASASYLMGIIASFTVGKIAVIHWRLAFLVYFIAFIVLYMNIRYLPKDKHSTNSVFLHENTKINKKAIPIIISMTLINIAFYTFSTSIALFMKNEHIGNDSTSGYVVAVFMAAGFFVGLITVNVRKATGDFSTVIAAVAMGMGYIMMSLTNALSLLMMSAALISSSYSIFYSNIFLKIGKISSSSNENKKLITYATAAMSTGQTVSVYILKLTESLLGYEGYRFRFAFLGISLFIAATIITILIFIHRKKKQIYNSKDTRNG